MPKGKGFCLCVFYEGLYKQQRYFQDSKCVQSSIFQTLLNSTLQVQNVGVISTAFVYSLNLMATLSSW